MKPTQPELKQTEFSILSWINNTADRVASLEAALTQFVTPNSGYGDGQKQALQPVGMLEASMPQIKAPRFVISKAFLRLHPQAITVESRLIGWFIRDDRQQFLLILGPGDRQVSLQFPFQSQSHILVKLSLARFDTQFINPTDDTFWQPDYRVGQNTNRVMPPQLKTQLEPTAISKASVGQKRYGSLGIPVVTTKCSRSLIVQHYLKIARNLLIISGL